MEHPVNLALLFFTYSFLGWCIEVTLKYFQYHRFINRGFLTGPWLPIYGSGAVLITISTGLVAQYDSSVGTTFLVSFVVCGIVEYVASWFMEKRYHARWWDYSTKPMNLNGRVWIGNLILFGLGGVLIVELLNPLLLRLFNQMTLRVRTYLAGFLGAVFVADFVVTQFVLKLVKTGVEHSQADNTEQIRQEVRTLLSDRNYFYKRFADAYPDVIYRTERITRRMEAVRAETDRLRQEAEQRLGSVTERLEHGREQLATALESSGSIRNTLLQDQQALLDMLYDEDTATDEMRALKGDIDRNRQRLRSRTPWVKPASADEEPQRSH